MHSKLRVGAGVGVAAVAALALTACGNSGGGGTGTGAGGTSVNGAAGGSGADGGALSLVADSMTATQNAGTVKITGTMSMPGLGSAGAATFTAQEQYSPSLEMSMNMSMAGQNINEVMVDSKIYMQYAALSALTGGKPWAEIDLSKVSSLGALSSMVDSTKNYNPTSQLSALLATGKITKVGTDTVDGQQATHYQGTLDPGALINLDAAKAHLTQAQVDALKAQLQSGHVTDETVDLWVGSGSLPVEIKVGMTTAAGAATFDMHFADWGAQMQVGAPPADQVDDITAQMSGALSGTGGSTSSGSGGSIGSN